MRAEGNPIPVWRWRGIAKGAAVVIVEEVLVPGDHTRARAVAPHADDFVVHPVLVEADVKNVPPVRCEAGVNLVVGMASQTLYLSAGNVNAVDVIDAVAVGRNDDCRAIW